MKTFAEVFAARGMDDWDVQQAIKRLQQALKRNLTRPDLRSYPNGADIAHYVKTGRTGPALTAAYVAQFDRANQLLPLAVPPAPTIQPAPQVATAPAVARPTRTRQSPRRNPLDALLGAVHDAHLASREALRRARHHIATA
ncbi:MAG: hypothetical protein HYY97_15895 [Rhodocyclales bacterium]|nr:hypothetical protein [Rhodocyclales bacterium]